VEAIVTQLKATDKPKKQKNSLFKDNKKHSGIKKVLTGPYLVVNWKMPTISSISLVKLLMRLSNSALAASFKVAYLFFNL
jgi:hypothetical protein